MNKGINVDADRSLINVAADDVSVFFLNILLTSVLFVYVYTLRPFPTKIPVKPVLDGSVIIISSSCSNNIDLDNETVVSTINEYRRTEIDFVASLILSPSLKVIRLTRLFRTV